MLTRGSAELDALRRVGTSYRKIGKATGRSAQTAANWCKGMKSPDDASRKALERAYGIAGALWDVAANAAGAPAAASTEPRMPDTAPGHAAPLAPPAEAAADHERRAVAWREKLEASAASAAALAHALDTERKAIETRARIERDRPTVEQLLDTPEAQELIATIVQAAAPWPLAVRAMLEAIHAADSDAVSAVELERVRLHLARIAPQICAGCGRLKGSK